MKMGFFHVLLMLSWLLSASFSAYGQSPEGITFTDQDAAEIVAQQRADYKKMDAEQAEGEARKTKLTLAYCQDVVKDMISWRTWMFKNLKKDSFVHDPEANQATLASWCMNSYSVTHEQLYGVDFGKNPPAKLVELFKAIEMYGTVTGEGGPWGLNRMFGIDFPKSWAPYANARKIVNVNPMALKDLHAVEFFRMLDAVCERINERYISYLNNPTRDIDNWKYYYQAHNWLQWAAEGHNARGFNFPSMFYVTSSGSFVMNDGVSGQVRAMATWAAPLQGEEMAKRRSEILGFNKNFLAHCKKTLSAISDYMQKGAAETTVGLDEMTELVLTDVNLYESLLADYNKTWALFSEQCDQSKEIGELLMIGSGHYKYVVASARRRGWSDSNTDLYELYNKAMWGLFFMAREIALRVDAPKDYQR